MKRTSQTLLCAAFFAALIPVEIYSQTTWDGGGGADTSWGTATNWNNNTLPSFNGTDSLAFTSGFGSNTSLTLGADRSIGRITFGGGSTAISLSGNTLSLNSTNTTAATGTALWNANTANNFAATVNSSILLQSGAAGSYTGHFRENNNSSGSTIFNGAITQGAGENWTIRFSRASANGVFVLANASNSISAIRNDGADVFSSALGAFSNAAITLNGGLTGTRTADHYTTPVSNSLAVNTTSSWVSQINTRLTGTLSQGSSSLSYGSSTTSSNILTRLQYSSVTGNGTTTLFGGSVSVSSMGQFSTGELNLGSSGSSVGVLVLSGTSGNEVPTWSDFSSARTFNQSGGANTWRINAGTAGASTPLFGGFAARGADLVIPASGGNLSNSTFARNFALGSRATLDGQRYANNAVKIETDIAYGTANGNRYFNIAGNENTSKSSTGIVLAGPVHELSGVITGNNVIIYPIGQSNSQLGIVRISNPNNSLTGTSRWILGGNRAAFTTIGGGNITAAGNMGDLATIVAIFTSDGAFGGATEVSVSSQSSSSQETTGAVLFEDLVGATTFSRNINLRNINQSTGAAAWGSYAGNVTYTGTATLGGSLTGNNNQILHVQSGTMSLGIAGGSAATIVNNMAGNTTFNKGGNGTLVLNNVTWSGSQGNNSWSIRGGAIRETGSTNATSLLGSNIAFAGGVLETNDTNQGGGFTRGLGTSSSTVQWTTGGGGFSAVGGPLRVNIGGSGASYTWGSTTNFLVSGSPLIFGSQSSDNVVTFQNAINLNNAQREIQVTDNSNSADDYAAITGNLTGTGSSGINKTGNGTLVLGDTNAYAGVTTISAGTLRISTIGNGGAVSSLGNSTNAASNLVFSGGALEYAGGSNGSTDRNFTITSGSSANIAVTGAGELTISGASTSTNGSLTKSGSGTLILTGNNLHTGSTTLANGILQAGNSGALGNGGDILFTGGTLRYTSSSNSTDYSSRIKNSTSAIVLDTNGTNVTLSSELAATNTGGLTKTGAGMLTISGSNNYSGSTAVSSGTLSVTGSIASSSTVQSGAVLIGTGTTGAVTVSSGALIGAGATANSVGTLTVGDLTLSGGGGYTWDISNTAGTAGTNWDLISASSTTITATSAPGNQFTIYLTGNPSNWSPSTSYSSGWNILSWGSSVTGFDASAFALNAGGFTGESPTGTWSFSNSEGYLKLVYTAPSSAADWTGGSGNWSSGANWQGGSAPSPGSSTPLVFTGAGGVSTNDDRLTTVSGITFGANGSYTVNGSAINLSGGITNNSSYAQTIALGVTLSAAQTFAATSGNLIVSGALDTNSNLLTIDGGHAVVISGNLSGAGSLTKNGSGALTLSGSNSYSGATTLNEGTLNLQGALDGSSISVSGGVFDQAAGGTISGSGSSISVSGGVFDQAAGGTISGSGSTFTVSEGTVSLAGTNTYTGATTLSSGTLNLDGSLSGSDISVSGGNFNQTGAISGSSIVVSGGTFYQSASGSITGSGKTFTLSGGAATFNGTNTYTGATTINSGTLSISGGNALSDSGSIVTANATGAALQVNGSETIGGLSGGGATGGGIVIASGQTLSVSQSTNTTFSGDISGDAAFTKTGSGTLTLNGTNSFTGITTIAGGNLTIAGSASLSESAVIVLSDVSGAVLHFGVNKTIESLSGGGSAGGDVSVASGRNLAVVQGGNTTFGGRLIGSGSFTKNGSGTLTLSGANTLTGNISIAGGNLTVSGGSAIADTANVSLSNTAGAVLYLADSEAIGNLFGSGGRVIVESGKTLTINQSATNLTFLGALSGNGDIVKSGNGRLKLEGNSSFSGSVTVNSGTLTLDNSSALGASASIVLADVTNTVLIIETSNSIGSLSGGAGGNITTNDGQFIKTLTLNQNTDTTYSGRMITTVALTKNGTGTLTLAGNNTHTGDTIVSGGTLRIGNGGTTGSLSGLGNLTTNATLAFNRSNTVTQGTEFRNVITGTGVVAQVGTGTLVLNGNNTYSGKTLVQSGTLAFTSGNTTATATQALGTNTALDLGVAGVSSGFLDYTGTGSATLAKNINALGHGNDTIRNSGTGLLTLSGTLTKNGTTLTLNGGANGINITGSIVGANANSDLVVDGGNVTLSSANTYNGPTIINSGTLTAAAAGALGSTTNIDINGGSLLVTAANAVSDSAGIILNGGRLAVSGNFNENVGALTLSSNSVIDFSGFSGTLRFSGVSSWAPSANLAIWNWSGTTYWGTQVNNYAAPSNLVFTNNSSISSNLANISFYSDSGSSFVGSGFEMSGFSGGGSEIIAVPEPEAWFAAAVLTAAAAYTAIRRRRKSFRFPLRRTPA